MARTRRTPEEVAHLLRTSGALPTAEEVEEQGFWFYPRHWLARWDETSMPPPPEILTEVSEDPRGRKYLSRRDLFRLGEQVSSPSDSLNFYVAVCSWGTGTKARDVYRRVPPLAAPQAAEKLFHGIGLVRHDPGSAVEAYKAFSSGEQSYLKGLGPAFFTKLLYFAVGTEAEAQGGPLILDQKVAKAIGWPAKTWWSAQEYQDYLELVKKVGRLQPEIERADCVEYAMFSTAVQQLLD